jgi:large repetitive protein
VTVTVTDSASVTDSKNYNVTIAPPGLAITTTSLPNGAVGVAYSTTVAATGGTPPYAWSASSLPAGLSINPSSGLISGTPTAAGTRTATVTVTDSATVTASNNFQVTIAPPSLVITTSSLPAGTVSATNSTSLSASGGTPPYTWSLASGPLPPGLTLSSAGLISGMPIAFGTFSFTVRVADSAGASTTGALSIIVARPLTLTGTLPAGVAGSSYSQTLMASNGTPPYVFAISVGALPPGLSLNSSTGAITGVPTTAGSYTFAAQVTDSAGINATQSFTISIARPLAIATTSLPSAGIGAQYNQTLSASGGLPPYSWSVSSGRLPPGLTLDFASGVVSGPATTEGTYAFTVSVSDSGGNVTAQGLSIVVTSSLTITSTSPLPPGAVGTAYSQALAAISGAPPYTWTVTAGSLPPGITLNASTGVLSGKPTTSGAYTFTLRVADASSTTASAAFSLTIVTALSITTTSLPGGSAGANYSATLAAVAGTSPYTWSITVGSLPQGLSLDAASGVISGKPGVEGTYAFTVQVKDAVGHTATQALTLVIAPALSPGGGALPDGVAGQPYSQQLTVTGGTAPYTFALASGSSLPAGLTLSGSGLLSGAPSAAGSFQFTVQITDSAGATAAHAYTLAIKVAALPGVAIAGLPATAEPLQQPTASVSLASAYPIDLTGQLVLTFQPDAAVPADDAAIQFSSGGRTADFSIPAGATQAAFPGASIQLQTGSTAGTITLTVHLSAAGVDATPNPPPSVSARISRSAPVIRKLSVVRTATGFEVWITGYSSSRELTQAAFQFTAAAGGNLQTTSATVPLGDPSKTWYQDASSANYGSQFTIVQPFTVTGNTNAVASVSVTLSNALGASAASSASF